jgi:uncharacterized protein YqgV (UPF0045/DUF77 family)
VLPGGLADKAAVYAAVDAAIAVVAESGLPYKVSPMETTIEGEYDVVMVVIKRAQEAVLAAGASRVFILIKVDFDPNGSSIGEKLAKYSGEGLVEGRQVPVPLGLGEHPVVVENQRGHCQLASSPARGQRVLARQPSRAHSSSALRARVPCSWRPAQPR